MPHKEEFLHVSAEGASHEHDTEPKDVSSSHEGAEVNWSMLQILTLVICVLGALILFLITCKLYFIFKKRCNQQARERNGFCRSHECVCRLPPGNQQVILTRDLQDGVHPARQNVPLSYSQISGYSMPRNQRRDNMFLSTSVAEMQLGNYGPYFNEENIEDPLSDFDSVNAVAHDVTSGPLKDLFKVTERSFTQTVCGKLLVSIARNVGHKGDVLYLDNMGISLHVPEGAVRRGEFKLIVLVLNWDLGDNPEMKKEESLVSPVVYVGPCGLKLEKPCTLTFRHCAFNPRQIKVMRSETELTDQKAWSALCGQADDTGVCYLTPNECRLTIDKFTLFTCVQGPLDNYIGKKWLQIAVFACPLRKDINHHQVRIYFLNKTNCALQWAIHNEENFGGKLICPEKAFLFDGSELDMFTETRYVSNGWELIGHENSERVSFLQIWHGHCPHISVCFRRVAGQTLKSTSVAIEMSLHVLTYQKTLEENGEKIFIQVFEDNKTPVTDNEIQCHHQIEIQINNYGNSHVAEDLDGNHGNPVADTPTALAGRGLSKSAPETYFQSGSLSKSQDNVKFVINNTFSASLTHMDSSNVRFTSGARPRLFPQCLRNRLILLLDPPKTPFGHDWKDLAAKLKMDACIPKLQTHESPTAQLLNCIENQGMSCAEVISLFREIGREDCVCEILKHLNKEAEPDLGVSREASENTYKYSENEDRLHSEEYSFTGSSYRGMSRWISPNSSRNWDSETSSKDPCDIKD